MAFIQIMECRTQQIDALFDSEREWEQASEGRRTTRRRVVARDRNDPDRYVIMVTFDSYESAMENSELPETQAFAARYGDFVDGAMTFHDLDVLQDKSD
jgi:quinol monooxygenase YgiN